MVCASSGEGRACDTNRRYNGNSPGSASPYMERASEGGRSGFFVLRKLPNIDDFRVFTDDSENVIGAVDCSEMSGWK